MSKKEKRVEVKVRPSRATRREMKRAQKAAAHLALCKQVIEFHKEYLNIYLSYETNKYEEIQARIAALQAALPVVEFDTEEEYTEIE